MEVVDLTSLINRRVNNDRELWRQGGASLVREQTKVEDVLTTIENIKLIWAGDMRKIYKI